MLQGDHCTLPSTTPAEAAMESTDTTLVLGQLGLALTALALISRALVHRLEELGFRRRYSRRRLDDQPG